jgi:hypothetical protein
MNLESLKENKFKDAVLKKEQMFKLNGGGTKTPGGSGCGTGTSASNPNVNLQYDFGYDVDRGNGWTTYHDRTNVKTVAICP